MKIREKGGGTERKGKNVFKKSSKKGKKKKRQTKRKKKSKSMWSPNNQKKTTFLWKIYKTKQKRFAT